MKIVRGAYMVNERDWSNKHGTPYPIWDDIQGTHDCYDDNVRTIIAALGPKDKVTFGSHNVASVELLKKTLTVDYPEKKNQVFIGQIYGFSDHLTFNLAEEGFQTIKCVVYGDYLSAFPWLIRRGQESRQVVREQAFQNNYLKVEIYKRLLGQ